MYTVCNMSVAVHRATHIFLKANFFLKYICKYNIDPFWIHYPDVLNTMLFVLTLIMSFGESDLQIASAGIACVFDTVRLLFVLWWVLTFMTNFNFSERGQAKHTVLLSNISHIDH